MIVKEALYPLRSLINHKFLNQITFTPSMAKYGLGDILRNVELGLDTSGKLFLVVKVEEGDSSRYDLLGINTSKPLHFWASSSHIEDDLYFTFVDTIPLQPEQVSWEDIKNLNYSEHNPALDKISKLYPRLWQYETKN